MNNTNKSYLEWFRSSYDFLNFLRRDYFGRSYNQYLQITAPIAIADASYHTPFERFES